MICQRCLLLRTIPPGLKQSPRTFGARRYLTTSQNAAKGGPKLNAPDATSSSASRRATTKPGNRILTMIKSSVSAGTPLKGLNFMKGNTDPLALEDSEYPDWLWTILEKPQHRLDSRQRTDVDSANLYSKSKKQRRLETKKLLKQQQKNPDSLIPKVPISEQSIDLPAGHGSMKEVGESKLARENLIKAMRAKRRGTIKESNFLKSMG